MYIINFLSVAVVMECHLQFGKRLVLSYGIGWFWMLQEMTEGYPESLREVTNESL